VRLLLDTHIFLWFAYGDQRLGNRVREAFLDVENDLFFSAASYWEICIKQSRGKLELTSGWEGLIDRVLAANGISWLAIEKLHCQAILKLPKVHKDPFDRLLVAQAKTAGLTVMTTDPHIPLYGVQTIS
jgi:PIN domain nuclease of toxin-antitoxin system